MAINQKTRSSSHRRFLLSIAGAVLLWVSGPAFAEPLNRQPLQVATVNGIQLAWTEMGDPEGVPMLMVMGLGASHRVWGEKFPAGLVELGFRLILFDNRDVGGSQRFDDWGEPVLWWNFVKARMGFEVSHAYTLSDMGDDAVALLDHLKIERAHVLGASMGGMIAQTIALEHPERVSSLISMMSSTGAPHLPPASEESSAALKDVAATTEDKLREVHEQGFYPAAIPRQLMAIMQSGDRSEKLRRMTVPTLVLHGEDDTLLPLAHGQHTAEVIPNAAFASFPGMAHDIPDAVRPALLQVIRESTVSVD